jgi:ectoine hydroxylase-related dioxygenase (phytanoyl-CoA dioxygenase family)
MFDVHQRTVFQIQAWQSIFEREGYCVLSHSELARSADRARDLFHERADLYKAATFRSTFQVADLSHRLTVHSSLVSTFDWFIKDVMVENRIIWAGFAVKQPSGELCFLDLHQDVSMCDLSTGRAAATAWIPLQDTGEKNGGMSVVPKAQFFDIAPRAYGELRAWDDKNMKSTLKSKAIGLALKSGQALFFHQRLLHFSAGNFSSATRVAVMLVLLPNETPVRLYRRGDRMGEVVPEDFYVKEPVTIR